MWYRIAQQKFNLFGLPISGNFKPVKEFADSEELDSDEDEVENVENLPKEEEITINDNTPENEITPDDIEANIEKMDQDPTINMKLPPLHDNCHCYIETLPILSQTNINDGRRVWKRSEQCCPVCEQSAVAFNQAEITRLLNSGIDVNTIS